jgi:DNA processing protein
VVVALNEVRDRAAELLVLDQLSGVGPVTVRRLVQRFGSARRALEASDRLFGEVAGPAAARERHDPGVRERVEQALENARAIGAEVVSWSDDAYPSRLFPLADPPPVLFLRGRRELLEAAPMVTIVGARRATARGRDVAERLGAALARAGVTVASGLALGVDGAAHLGALRATGNTLAVLGTGPDVAYPASHRALFGRILDHGLLVSEFLPGTSAAPHHFPRRNRILAALASVTVVVEAGRRSGSLITVDHALDLGRDIWAVPGPIDTSVCAGSNRLLVDGATPLISIDAFVAGVAGPTANVSARRAVGVSVPGDLPGGVGDSARATDLEARVLSALSEDALLADELSARFALPVHETLALLTTLELHGEVVRLPGMRYRRAA